MHDAELDQLLARIWFWFERYVPGWFSPQPCLPVERYGPTTLRIWTRYGSGPVIGNNGKLRARFRSVKIDARLRLWMRLIGNRDAKWRKYLFF